MPSLTVHPIRNILVSFGVYLVLLLCAPSGAPIKLSPRHYLDCNVPRLCVQISRVCRENDRRLLFRGWSRLCLHAASLNAAETAFATATATARAARADAEAKEAAAAVTAADIAANAAEVHQRLEAVEMNARKHARRADDAETRAAEDTEKSGPQENIAGVSETTATVLKRAEDAERAFHEQKRQQAVRIVSTRHMY